MPAPCVVVALGGNALIRPGQRGSYAEQVENLASAVPHLAQLAKRSRLVLTHGNGPQVGDLLLQQEHARKVVPAMPLHAAVAMSQGFIGALLQESLDPALQRAGVRKPVITIVTQTLVDPKDPAFRNPSKPVGPFYPSKAALPKQWKLAKTPNGWRRLVPSPEPRAIIEARTIQEASAHSVVVACGGGGVPVARAGRTLRGVDAVIDKDLSAALLARTLGAQELIILTDVDAAYTGYGLASQKPLRSVTVSELRALQGEGHFAAGSMGPKVEAACRFVESAGSGSDLRPRPSSRRAVIARLDHLEAALSGRAGTQVTEAPMD